jgi:hypothetical protein
MCKVDLAANLKNKQVEAVSNTVSGSKQTRSTIHDTPLSIRVWLVANAFLGYLGGSRGWEGGVRWMTIKESVASPLTASSSSSSFSLHENDNEVHGMNYLNFLNLNSLKLTF